MMSSEDRRERKEGLYYSREADSNGYKEMVVGGPWEDKRK